MPSITMSSSSPPQLVFSLLVSCLLFLLVSVVLFSSSPISAAANTTATTSNLSLESCIPEHVSALLKLKRGFNFSYALNHLSSWNASHKEHCCSWEGITCSTFAPGHVIGLNLSGLFVAGVLDFKSLFQLQSLERLDLSFNHFDASPIPPGFSHLSNLTHLDLRGCSFYGQIPSDISPLTRLVSLDLSFNSLLLDSSGLGEFLRNLSSLRELYLDGVNMSAVGSQWSQILPNTLRKVSMYNCDLSGPFHPSFSRLYLLTHLRVSYNYGISSPVPQFIANFTSLIFLDLADCGLSGEFPKGIFGLPELKALDISSNPFLTISPPQFFTNSSIQQLIMSETKFLGSLADILGNFKSLTYLDLRNSSILGPITQTQHVNSSQLFYLDLSQNNIQGPIPALIFDLTQIRSLELSANNFTGAMDLRSFQNLQNLRNLDLSYNNLSVFIDGENSVTHSIPQSPVNLSQLVELSLSNNRFQGVIPRFISKNLQYLDLSYNSFSAISSNISQHLILILANNNFQGPIPRQIFEQTQLLRLDLSSNNFSGIIDLGLFHNFKNLSFLDLSYNSLTVVNDARSNSTSTSFPQLVSLFLTSCNMSEFPDLLRNQKETRLLDLSCNRISGKIPKWIWTAVINRGVYLNMSNNALEGLEGPFPHLSLSSMRTLDLSANFLKGSILIPPPSSIFFSLANNSLHGDIPSLICNATILEILDLSSNNFVGVIPQCLGQFSDVLRVLNLHKNAFGGSLLQKFKAGCKLEILNLSDNELEGEMPMSLIKCEQLRVLNLGNNHIRDLFPLHLANLLELRVLILRSNEFYGSVGTPPSVSQRKAFFSQLQIIDVSSNNLSGKLPSNFFSTWKKMKNASTAFEFLIPPPPESPAPPALRENYEDRVVLTNKGLELDYVKILTALTVVDLSCNQFHGNIPSSIGELKSLVVLNLSHNHFEGQIPPSLANLKQLESLDLSQNSLSGKIPELLSKLSFLGAVNLSKNHLSGSIPQGGHFGTFQNNSFLGNPGLCGPPLSSKCREEYVPPPRLLPSPSSKSKKQHESPRNFMWIGFAVGHSVGFGVFFWTMVLWRKGRHAFFELFDKCRAFFINLFLGKKLWCLIYV